ncbi:MAG: glycosyltransferase family 4 protein [Arenicellaceae bacterium]|nr:glycosyltransferase family 4 protein [Arenicellaceae bacterium]
MTLKTAYVANCDLPNRFAHSIQIMKNAQAWHRNSREFLFISNLHLKSWLNIDKTDLSQFYGLSDSFDAKFFPYRDLIGLPTAFLSEIYFRKATGLLEESNVELVFTRTFELPKYTVPKGIPTLVETHGPPDNSKQKNDLYRLLEYDALLGLVTISEPLKDRYIAHGLPAEKILVAADGVDMGMFSENLEQDQARAKLGLDKQGQYAVYVGHLYDDRGIQEILAAAAAHPSCNFLLVGGHPEHVKKWQGIVNERGLDNTTLTGFVNNSEVSKYLWAADILMMPYSQHCPTAEWMSPLKLFEYMAAGRAILATNLDAIQSVLTDGVNAVLVEPDNADSFTSGFDKLINDSAFRNLLAAKAKAEVQGFSWDQRVKNILEYATARLALPGG